MGFRMLVLSCAMITAWSCSSGTEDSPPNTDAEISADSIIADALPMPGDADPTVDAHSADMGAQPRDQGVSDATLDAAINDAMVDAAPATDAMPSPDMGGPIEAGPCPEGPFFDDCAFGWTSRELRESNTLRVTEGANHRATNTMDELTQRQLVYGFMCEALFMPDTPAEALAVLDDGVTLYRVVIIDTGEAFTWLRFYQGDTEVGHLFAEGTMDLVARVSDQDIVDCLRD
jgi:hypothetical protein